MKKLYFLTLFLLIISCKIKDRDYINYYVKVNEADSTFRLAHDTLKATKMYKEIFKKYEPRNQYAKRELENYIAFCDQYKMNFGGKRMLKKLIKLEAPNRDAFYSYGLLKKYGIDSLEVIKGFDDWEKGLNKVLLDSFKIAYERDQSPRKDSNKELMTLNDRKNEDLLIWTFNNNNFPTIDKIGTINYNYPIKIITIHMCNTKRFDYFDKKLLEYVDKGYIRPIVYAEFVDRYYWVTKNDCTNSMYAAYRCPLDGGKIKDSVQANRNRKKIGLPSLLHNREIIKQHDRYLKYNYNKKMNLKEPKNDTDILE